MYDIVIVGGGPAGLTAAIKAGTEGRKALVLDAGEHTGGRAFQSPMIENVPGFPEGITGRALFGRMTQQAHKFGAEILTHSEVIGVDRISDRLAVTVAGSPRRAYMARSVILAMGEITPRLDALNGWEGRGVDYACNAAQLHKHAGQDVVLIGGGNSCAQLALSLAETDAKSVTILTRSPLLQTTSAYLRERLSKSRVVVTRGVVATALGNRGGLLKSLDIASSAPPLRGWNVACQQAYCYIGGVPPTGWFTGAKDDQGYILTADSYEVRAAFYGDRAPLPQETSIPGVFAAGDIRSGATGGITSGFGEGTQAFQHIHRTYLPEYTAAPAAVLV